MRKLRILILGIICSCFPMMALAQTASQGKRERNFIKEGNELYNQKRYSEAEVAYRKAIQENANSEKAQFNLAASLLRQVSLASGQEDNGENKIESEALQLLKNLAQGASDETIAELSYYNLGNVAFNKNDFQNSINMYKGALRKNPDNDKARENLRLAQLKLQEQQNQQQNQDQNQDQQDQQDQQQQQNQDQQNQEQNQDNDQNQVQQNQNQQNKDQQNQDQQQQEQGGISDMNAAQILKAMENQENATRKKVEAQKAKEEQNNSSRHKTDKPW